MNRASSLAVLAVAVAVAVVVAVGLPAAASGGGAAGTLQIRAGLSTTWQTVTCPAGTTGANPYCYAIKGKGLVPGLGQTQESYSYVVEDSTTNSTLAHFAATVAVPGKGTIDVSAATPKPYCPCTGTATFDFTVTGGTGAYAGAGGSGTVVMETSKVGKSLATWKGTLTVPGYTFDTTAPVIKGAVAKTVKARKGAKRVRVTYKVTARDPGEGSLPVKCTPRSGSRFKLGRTTVRCSATDTNGNTAKKSFAVTVKRA